MPASGWFLLSLLLGALLGTVTALLLRGAEGYAVWGALIGTLLLGVGTATRFGLCTIFVTFVMGIALAGFSKDRRVLRRMVGSTERAVLYPMLLELARRFPGRPLALLDVGTSAGLNLGVDTYRYDYGGAMTGAPAAPGVPVIACDLPGHGLADAFGHGTGHGLGLEVHEEPRIARQSPRLPDQILEPGMVFTIEPGAYVPGVGGVRIEDDVLVTADGCEVLTVEAGG